MMQERDNDEGVDHLKIDIHVKYNDVTGIFLPYGT